MNEEKVILVNEQDEEMGLAGKMQAHEEGWLHRAFSVFIFTKKGDMLLQRRSLKKYHCGGLWTNACCSHPRAEESVQNAAQRRLKEEMGIEVPVQKLFDFVYRAEFDNGLTEHEFDHVFVGEFEGKVPYDKEEVMEIGYYPLEQVEKMVAKNPADFTPWFRIALPRVAEWRQKQKN